MYKPPSWASIAFLISARLFGDNWRTNWTMPYRTAPLQIRIMRFFAFCVVFHTNRNWCIDPTTQTRLYTLFGNNFAAWLCSANRASLVFSKVAWVFVYIPRAVRLAKFWSVWLCKLSILYIKNAHLLQRKAIFYILKSCFSWSETQKNHRATAIAMTWFFYA